MKRISLIAFLILVQSAFAVKSLEKRVDASVNNIPSVPTRASYPGLLFTIPNQGYKSLEIDNKRGTSEVAVNCQYSDLTTAPPTSDTSWIYVDAAQSKVFDNETIGNQCFMYTPSGAPITSGITIVHIWGQ